MSSTLQSIIFLLLGIIGGELVSYYFASRGRISFQYNTYSIVNRDLSFPKDLNIVYKGREIEKLNRTYIVFWNS